jgi:hypothetical protein
MKLRKIGGVHGGANGFQHRAQEFWRKSLLFFSDNLSPWPPEMKK